MTRNDIVRISQAIRFGHNISNRDATNLLIQYCIDKGKRESDATEVAHLIMHTPFLEKCLSVALEYYENKFNICKLYSAKQELLSVF